MSVFDFFQSFGGFTAYHFGDINLQNITKIIEPVIHYKKLGLCQKM